MKHYARLNDRLGRLILLSLLLHAAILALPLRQRLSGASPTHPAALSVHLQEAAAPQRAPAPPADRLPAAAPSRASRATAGEMPGTTEKGDGDPTPGHRIDLEQVRATARRYARETDAGGRGDVPAGGRTERSTAQAQLPDTIVERREVDGWVVRIGGRRCVIAPVDVPHFMRGITVAPVCEAASR